MADPVAYAARDFSAEKLAAQKDGLRISLCIPAKDEEATVGQLVRAVARDLVERVPLVDEVVVIDDRSSDTTASVARAAGARVLGVDDVLPHLDPRTGKGEALWKSVAAADGDVIVWVDADLRRFDSSFVTGLVAPFVTDPTIDFVKGWYAREGGRVTELVARPVLALLFPHLAGFAQPLAGEYGGRRSLLEALPFVGGYGVDIGLLIDVAAKVGLGRMAQVDLGVRVHRNRPLDELSPQALAVLRTALVRAGVEVPAAPVLVRPGEAPLQLSEGERPPLREVLRPPGP
ncbi:MAG TPA: glucosyl-3-phosphoglycerate synthase [Acidimicrobiales bacterium]